ncbi:MAG: OmpA family protein [Pseudomonadota bacterium]
MKTNVVHVIMFFGLLLLPISPASFSLALAEAKEPHGAVTPYPGSSMTRRTDEGFGSYDLVTGFNPDGKTDDELFETLSVDGVVTKMSFENPKERSHTEIFTNYREALENAGFNVLFSCGDEECGPNYIRSGWQRVTDMTYFTPKKHYLSASANIDGQKLYVAMVVAPLRHQIYIVEGGEMERGLVSAALITEGLLANGRVILDGLFFATDKSDLLPASTPALEVIADFLKANPTLNVYIVGHTDSTGGLDYNLALSRSRARAVVDVLVADYGINKSRLDAHGVGPLSPASSNQGEQGRAANRRVEMVER